jgi:hypothetical protein
VIHQYGTHRVDDDTASDEASVNREEKTLQAEIVAVKFARKK